MVRKSVSTTTFAPLVLADGLTFIGLFAFLPTLAGLFKEPNGINALVLSLGFLVFCAGVFFLRRLQPANDKDGEWLARSLRIIMAVIFALTMSLAIAWQLGFFESGPLVDTRDLGEGGSAVYFVFAPGAWLGFAFIYVLVLAFSVSPSMSSEDRKRPVIAFLCLMAINAMLLLLSAQAYAIFGGRGLIWIPLVFAWLFILFLPPRLLYLARMSERSSGEVPLIIGALIALLAFAAFRAVTGL
jgi:hypothetical protein